MDKLCSFCCKNNGVYKKRVINSISVSGKPNIKYGTVYICDSDICFDLYQHEKKHDDEWVKQILNGL